MACLLAAGPAMAGEGGTRFSRELYEQALTQLEQLYRNVRATGLVQRADYEAGNVHWILDDAFQSEITYPDVRTGALQNTPRILVRNEGGAELFKLARDRQDSPFYIAGLGSDLQGDVVRFHRRYCRTLTLAATHIFDYSMRELLEDPDVLWRVGSAPGIDNDADGRVTVVLDISAKKGYFQEILVRFDPNTGWLITDYELKHVATAEGDSPATFLGTVKYGLIGPEKVRFPETVSIELEEPSRERERIVRWTLKDVQFGGVVAEQFSLDHFGLGAKKFDASGRRIPWFLIINVMMVLICGGYLAFRRRS
jgi:hypothetical protein